MRPIRCAAAGLGVSALLTAAARADVFTNVPTSETNGYQLVYDLNIPTVANYAAAAPPAYTVNTAGAVAPGAFGRVAYYMELDTGSGTQWVYASMDRFTPYANKTGVPYLGSLGAFQTGVSNVNVFSNVAGLATGTGRTGYNLEFWPTNYDQTNPKNVPNASATAYDWGDNRTAGNYGSMQLHDNANGQTLFAFNRWGGGAGASGAADLGIGNNTVLPSGQTVVPKDWTFRNNAGDYTVKRLQVLVGGAAPAAPAVGVGAPAQVYANAPETQGMIHVHTLAVPQTGNAWNAQGVPYSVDNSARIQPGSFDRVGYYMELTPTGGGATQYAYVSMDAFTNDPTKVGVPATDSGALFQQNVSRMTVVSNVAGVVNGTNLATGNIEFWPSNYAAPKAATSPANASDTTFDFGDSGANLTAGHGSFQIHNFDIDGTGPGTAGQTIMAISDWGGNTPGDNIEIGIGNNPSGNPDYTLTNTGQNYTVRNLYVFVHPTAAPEPAAAGLLAVAAAGLLRRRRPARPAAGR